MTQKTANCPLDDCQPETMVRVKVTLRCHKCGWAAIAVAETLDEANTLAISRWNAHVELDWRAYELQGGKP